MFLTFLPLLLCLYVKRQRVRPWLRLADAFVDRVLNIISEVLDFLCVVVWLTLFLLVLITTGFYSFLGALKTIGVVCGILLYILRALEGHVGA
jgi:hypothetical protein